MMSEEFYCRLSVTTDYAESKDTRWSYDEFEMGPGSRGRREGEGDEGDERWWLPLVITRSSIGLEIPSFD